jgi:hypothetical protein
MLEEIDSHVRRSESFAFETTLSGLMYARLIPKWRQLGYRVKLIYLRLPNPEMAVERVAYRVAQVVTRFLKPLFGGASRLAGDTSIRHTSFSSMPGRCMIILNHNRFLSRRA